VCWEETGRQDAGATGKPHFTGEEPKSGLGIRRADLKFGHYIRLEFAGGAKAARLRKGFGPDYLIEACWVVR
jgi:hypothetical protein